MFSEEDSIIVRSKDSKALYRSLRYTVSSNSWVRPVVILDDGGVDFYKMVESFTCNNSELFLVYKFDSTEDLKNKLTDILRIVDGDFTLVINKVSSYNLEVLSAIMDTIKNYNNKVYILATLLEEKETYDTANSVTSSISEVLNSPEVLDISYNNCQVLAPTSDGVKVKLIELY